MEKAKHQLARPSTQQFVRKSNSLVEASYKLSTNEQRVILLLCTAIRPDDKDFEPYRIRIKEFSELIGLKNKNIYSEVEKLVVDLREKTLKITTGQSVLHVGWLSSIEYFSGEGIIELCFDPKLRPFLLDLQKRFTSYRLKQVIQLKSSFSIRLYELLKQYEGIGERIIGTEQLKEILGTRERSYSYYGSFKQKVLQVAQKEINEKTDLLVEFEEVKLHRKVEKLKFIIRANEKSETNSAGEQPPFEPGNEIGDMDRLLQKLPLRYQRQASVHKLLVSFLNSKGVDYVTRNIEYANAKSNAVHKGASPDRGSNYRNYLAMALRGDFGLPFKDDMDAAQNNELVNQQKEAELARVRKDEMAKARMDQQNIDRARIYQESLTAEALAKLRGEAFDSLDDQQKGLILRRTPGSDILLKIAMNKLCMTRMHVSQPELFAKEETSGVGSGCNRKRT